MALRRPLPRPRNARPVVEPNRVAANVPRPSLDRLVTRLDEIQARLMRDPEVGYGSNAWAVMGNRTRSGDTLLAADGHLPLTIPALFYQIGLDTQTLGGGDIHQVGIALAFLAVEVLASALAIVTFWRSSRW